MKFSHHLSAAVALGTLIISVPLWAHHGSSESYDVAKRSTLKGVVTEFVWSNPHAQIHFDAKDENGQIVNWTGEMNSPGVLAKHGWTRHAVKPGDQISVTLVPSRRSGSRLGLVGKVVLANGEVLEGNQGLRP
jgi:hypothetical protein